MELFWTVLGSGFGGSLLTLFVKAGLDRRDATRSARRSLYVELLTVLSSRRTFMQSAIFDPSARSTDYPQERIDSLNALLLIDATAEVRRRTKVCFELLNRFHLSRSASVPVEVDDHGFYRHRWDQVNGQPDETRDMLVRVCLGGIADDFGAAVDAVAAQVKSEIH